jgi:hypothetical protein
MADNIFYRDCFVKTTVIEDEDGIKLDLPFQIYHQTIVENGNNHYCYLNKSLVGKEVIVYIHYAIADEQKVKEFKGYLGNKWAEVQKDEDVEKHWNITKAESLATFNEGVKTLYTGIDKDERVAPYPVDNLLK